MIGAVLPIGEVSGIAYQRIRCISKDARDGKPHHTNFNLVTSEVQSFFGFSSVLLNYFYDYFHINNDNEYLSEAEQDEEDWFFDQMDED